MSPAPRKPSHPPDKSSPPSPGQAAAEDPDRSQAARPSKPAPGLYIVATPIGNAGDISVRALELLRQADMVAAEDTRVTAKLFARYGIATRLTAYHDHNAERVRPAFLARLAAGAVVALVSDAGTPLISIPATSWCAPRSPPVRR